MKIIIELNGEGDELINARFEKDGKIVRWNDLTLFQQIGVCAGCLACYRFYSKYLNFKYRKKKK